MRSDQKQILEEGGFTLVTKSKRNRRSNKSAKKAPITVEDPPEDSEAARSKLLRQAKPKFLQIWCRVKSTKEYLLSFQSFAKREERF